MTATKKIEVLVRQMKAETSRGGDARLLADAWGAMDRAMAQVGQEKRGLSPLFVGIVEVIMKVMRNGFVQVGAAVVVVIAVIGGIHLAGGRVDGTSVAWGQVAAKVAEAEGYSCVARTKSRSESGETKTEWEMRIYSSKAFGLRQDKLVAGRLTSMTYVTANGNEVVVVELRLDTKEYFKIRDMAGEQPPCDAESLVESFASKPHVNLGRRVMNWVMVEGIGVDNILGEGTKGSYGKLWVGVKTGLPVRIETKRTGINAGGQKVEWDTVMEGFEWGNRLDENEFKCVIPPDFTPAPGSIDNEYDASIPTPINPTVDANNVGAQVDALLEFRVIPNIGGQRPPVLSKGDFATYRRQLEAGGPNAEEAHVPNYVWYKLANEEHFDPRAGLPIARFENQPYLLVCAQRRYVMVSSEGGHQKWGLTEVYETTDHMGQPAIGVKFDRVGRNLLYELSRTNIGNGVANIVKGQVFWAPHFGSAIREPVTIAGKFTVQEAEDIIADLKKGLPPTK